MNPLLAQCSIKIALILTLISSCRKNSLPLPHLSEKEFDLPAFNSIYSADPVTVTVKQADGHKVRAKGSLEDLQRTSCSVTGNVLDISLTEASKSPVEFIIELPVLLNLKMAGGSAGSVSGFEHQTNPLNIVCSGNSITKIHGAPPEMNNEVGGSATLEITGTTKYLEARVFADGRLKGYRLSSKNARIELSGQAETWVLVDSCIDAMVSGHSILYYKGNPVVSSIQITSNGTVIHQ